MSRDPEVLDLLVGDVNPFDVFLFDERDEPENLGSATAATLTVAASKSSTPEISLDTGAGDLSIDSGDSKLVGTLTQSEADNLTPGTYIGGVAVQFPSGWFHSDAFYVRISKPVSGTI